MDAAHYRCEAASIAGFVQQVAVSYVSNGYFFYVAGLVPVDKDPRAVDAKLIARYGIDISKWTRSRRKRAGEACVQYIRCGRRFLILATHGSHRFFEGEGGEGGAVRDCRRVPIKCFGYAISVKRGHAHVRVERGTFARLKAYLVDYAVHHRAEAVADALARLPFEPYAPVRRQLLALLRAINRARRAAGYTRVGHECLRFRRRIVRPFVTDEPCGREKLSSAG